MQKTRQEIVHVGESDLMYPGAPTANLQFTLSNLGSD